MNSKVDYFYYYKINPLIFYKFEIIVRRAAGENHIYKEHAKTHGKIERKKNNNKNKKNERKG